MLIIAGIIGFLVGGGAVHFGYQAHIAMGMCDVLRRHVVLCGDDGVSANR